MKSFILNHPRAILLGGLMLFVSSLGWAQKTSGNITQQNDATAGTTGRSVRVIDNKGTIKYLQSSNGITSFTNTTSDVTTTTWQLGGTLTDDTYIDVDGKVFALVGVGQETGSAATSFTLDSSGYTLLVRDEATGAVKKLVATDLLQGGHHVEVLASDEPANFNISVSGVSTDYKKVSVYRNGAKLVGGDTSSTTNDYTVATDLVSILVSGFTQAYSGDVFEVQWVK